jgi:phage tail tape-measure protein
MFKRVRWVAVGFGAGIGASVYAYKTLRNTVERHTTPELRDAGRRVNALRRDVQAAVSEGRVAMHEREAELNAQISNGSHVERP